MRLIWTAMATAAMTAMVGLAAPDSAQACGGTFCDTGPAAMPVDQTGENILFVLDGGRVEAHIQIQYDPSSEAEQFAWVIPLQQVPEFTVGSQVLFDNLLNASVPTYGLQQTFETCGDELSTGGDREDDGAGDSGSGGGDGDGDGDGTGGPDVVLETTVGAFDVVVLSGGTSEEVMTWLGDNGYQQDPAAEPILGEYLEEGFLFAAFKLTNGAAVSEIHPVTLTFDGAEACVPLRLSRIAAAEDMEVRTFFLSSARVVPRNYRHVLVNPLKLDWLNFAANYKEVITMAVDADQADGRAFVTEYAGPSNVVPNWNLYNPSWDASPFGTIDPIEVIQSLIDQNILWCAEEGTYCEFYHPLIESVLAQYLPVPQELTRDEFYGCLSCFEAMIDTEAWDGDAFTMAYQERIIDPAMHAVALLEQWPYLTRMYTLISPAEMIEDPFFHANENLPEVPSRRIGVQNNLCNGDSTVTLPDGRYVYLPNGEQWPEFEGEMPWEEDVERMPAAGSPENLVDQTPVIDAILADYNASAEPEGFDGVTSTSTSCSCTTGSPGRGMALSALALVMGVGLRRRRRA